jgi:hypothetical protein
MTGTEVIPTIVAGQIWTYRARPGEEASRVTILKTESDPKLGTIIHIAVEGVTIRNPRAATGRSSTIGHMPYQEAALRRSLVALTNQNSAAPNLEGYKTWKEAFDKGKAGIWSIALSEAIAAMEKAFAQ